MGADMKRALIKLYDKLHLSHPMWSVKKFVLKFQNLFLKLKKVSFYHSKKRQRLQLRTYLHLLTILTFRYNIKIKSHTFYHTPLGTCALRRHLKLLQVSFLTSEISRPSAAASGLELPPCQKKVHLRIW
jgi:hypothetical protein